MEPVVVTSSTTLTSPAADVWPLVTDTDRTNRLLFGDGAVYRPATGTSAARFVAETKVAGFALEYEEAPFEWTLHKAFSVYRKMRGGPLRSYTYGIKLEPSDDGGTRLDVRLELLPRHWMFRPVAHLQGKRIVSAMTSLGERIDAHLRDSAPSPYLRPASPANHERLAWAKRELDGRGLDAAAIGVVLSLVENGPDADVIRIRPFEVAHDANVSGREVLRVLLHAVTIGVVELRWALVCPSCRTANDQVLSLSEITDASHCQLCDIRYGIELDRAVEATFRPHPSVREVTDRMFCIGGPWRTPHVLVQANLEPGAKRALDLSVEAGRYRLFARGGSLASLDLEEGADAETYVKLEPAGFSAAELKVRPGGRLVVENATNDALHLKVERLGYATLAATAHVVTTMDEFRRLFSRELLKPGTPLKVAHAAILFTDLTGSTALYSREGDAAAFRFVDDHFDVLRKEVAEAGGTVVKTMGDAVLAAFVDDTSCLRASISLLRAFEAFRATSPSGAHTGLKIGFYAGPCYVITANDTIDYFGQTVNCASRVQHLANSAEIVLEASVLERAPAELAGELSIVERFETTVKGVAEPLQLVRARLA